jgi:hypothetical protein
MKLLIMQFSPTSCHFIPLRFKYSPQHTLLRSFIQSIRPSPRPRVTFRNKLFAVRNCVRHAQPPSWGTTLCRLSTTFIQYISWPEDAPRDPLNLDVVFSTFRAIHCPLNGNCGGRGFDHGLWCGTGAGLLWHHQVLISTWPLHWRTRLGPPLFRVFFFVVVCPQHVQPGSSVGIATGYWLYGSGAYQWVRGTSGIKLAWAWSWPI